MLIVYRSFLFVATTSCFRVSPVLAVIGICPLADIRNCPEMVNSVTERDWTLDLVRSLPQLRSQAGALYARVI